MSNRHPADSVAELLRRLALDQQQNGVLGLSGLSHPFVSCVNRRCIGQSGNDWSEHLPIASESVHRGRDEIGFESDDQRGLTLPLL